jgi:hypothetical protein
MTCIVGRFLPVFAGGQASYTDLPVKWYYLQLCKKRLPLFTAHHAGAGESMASIQLIRKYELKIKIY